MTNSSKENPPPSPPKDNNPNENTKGALSSSSSSSSPSKTPPRAIIPSGPGASSGGGSSAKKKGKKKDDQQVVVVQKRKRGEMDAPKSEPICPLCGKKFASWKGYFGHLRAHPEREWRGAFPPPKGDAASWLPLNLPPEQILAPALWEAFRLVKMRQEQTESRVLNLDLNKEPPEEPVAMAGPSLPPPPPPPPPPPQGGLDLNLPPSQENEDEEDVDRDE